MGPCIAALHVWIALIVSGDVCMFYLHFAVGVGSSWCMRVFMY